MAPGDKSLIDVRCPRTSKAMRSSKVEKTERSKASAASAATVTQERFYSYGCEYSGCDTKHEIL